MWNVYELRSSKVEYVGITSRNVSVRLNEHINLKPNGTNRGKFYKQDLTIHIVKTLSSKGEALLHETELKKYHGLVPIEHITSQIVCKKLGESSRKLTESEVQCIRSLDKPNISDLSKKYNVSTSTIYRILRSITYNGSNWI